MEFQGPYCQPIDDGTSFGVPETISEDLTDKPSYEYLFVEEPASTKSMGKWMLTIFTLLIMVIITWEIYTTFTELIEISFLLGNIFFLLLAMIISLVLLEGYKFYKGQNHLEQVAILREQAEMFVNERSHGKSSSFIESLRYTYKDSPQGDILHKALMDRPDYLNDAEIITHLSENFFIHLDKEAQRLIAAESFNISTLVALSPLVVVDSLVVLWRTTKMINQINRIYGLRLTQIGQWQNSIKIIKTTLLAAGSEIVISSIAGKVATDMASVVASSVAQGLVVGGYAAKVGLEAMRADRPITFTELEQPNIKLIVDAIKIRLLKLKENDE
ncbi:MAG: DUF697 domain-containing protein [Methylophagaceae bacterium]